MKISKLEINVHLSNGFKIPIEVDWELSEGADIRALIKETFANEMIYWAALGNLPMHRPPPGPIENANAVIDNLIEDGLAKEKDDGLVVLSVDGHEALAEFRREVKDG